jgi:acyl-coenzyme A thioesterase PaaI-like protein
VTAAATPSPPVVPSCAVSFADSVERRFGLRDCGTEGGVNRCAIDIPPWSAGIDGGTRWGVLATPMDHLMGQSIHDRRPVGHSTLTVEMTVDYHHAFTPGATLSIYASASSVDDGGGHAIGWAVDPAGTLVATGRAWMAFVPADRAAPRVRVVRSEPSAALSFEECLGVRYDVDNDVAIATMPLPWPWTNDMGYVHGGVWGCLAEQAASKLVGDGDPGLRPAAMTIRFLRPGLATSPATLTARYERRGRRSATVDVTGTVGDAGPCTRATVTYRPGDL